MNKKVYFYIVFRIILLTGMGFCVSWIFEGLHEFLGDVYNNQYNRWDWSTRHYWAFWGCVLLFLASLVDSIVGVVGQVRKNYDTSKW